MASFADRVKETTTTTGTGTVNLDGAASAYRTFVAGIGSGNKCYYCIAHQTANEWEVGFGTVTSGTPDTLSRDVVLSSSNSGSLVSFSAGTKDAFVTIPSAVQPLPTKTVEPIPLHEVAGTIVNKAGTVTGTAGVGSSLFLSRIRIPSVMSVSEIQAAMSIGFAATNQGAGTMSRYFGLYSFGNSTSLASQFTASATSAWSTGTSTTAGAASLTQFQGGWSAPFIQPMSFASSSVQPGEYVVAQLFDFAQASSTWTLNFYGAQAANTALASAATNLTSATLGAMSSGGLSAASGVSGVSSYGAAFLALSTAGSGTAFVISQTVSSAASSVSLLLSSGNVALSATNTAKSISFQLAGISSNSNIVSSVGTVAGSIHTGSNSLSAVTNVALGALASSTLAATALPNFGFIGTGSTTSGYPTAFQAGIMSTGALPANITLTSTAVTFSGSAAFQIPWLMLVGA